MFQLRFVSIFLLLLIVSSCGDGGIGTCETNDNCRATQVCDTDNKVCVQCLSDATCGANQFCCRGNCEHTSRAKDFCGCQNSIAQSGGARCSDYEAFGVTSIGGPLCLSGRDEADWSTVKNAKCGCLIPGDCNKSEGQTCLQGRCQFVDECRGECESRECFKGSCACSEVRQCNPDYPNATKGRAEVCVNADSIRGGKTVCACTGFTLAPPSTQQVSCPFDYQCCGEKGCCKGGCASGTCIKHPG